MPHPGPETETKERIRVKASVEVDAGICGFKTSARVDSEDDRHVAFDVTSDCDKITALGDALKERGSIDAYREIGPASESALMQAARSVLTGCCAGCAVPSGLFKAMQVAAGVALPKDISMRLSKE